MTLEDALNTVIDSERFGFCCPACRKAAREAVLSVVAPFSRAVAEAAAVCDRLPDQPEVAPLREAVAALAPRVQQ